MPRRFTILACAIAAASVHSAANAQIPVAGGPVDIALLVAASECVSAGTPRTAPDYQVCIEAHKKILNEAATAKRTSEMQAKAK
jgi:hypothetical protein